VPTLQAELRGADTGFILGQGPKLTFIFEALGREGVEELEEIKLFKDICHGAGGGHVLSVLFAFVYRGGLYAAG